MKRWDGSAGVCINENGEVLMVLQGKPEETKKWTVPSGGREIGETFEVCCIREIEEETGYIGEVVDEIKVKSGYDKEEHIPFEVHYFFVTIVGGERKLQDPDDLIQAIAWKSKEEIQSIELSFPEDRVFLFEYLTNNLANRQDEGKEPGTSRK